MILRRSPWRRAALFALCLLVVPFPEARSEAFEGEPFTWNRDAYFEELRARFEARRAAGCASFDGETQAARVSALAAPLWNVQPNDPRLNRTANALFEAAAEFAACPDEGARFVAAFERIRAAAKGAARNWSEARGGRRALYTLLYGGRLAVEEVLLQMAEMPALSVAATVASDAPSVMLHGVRVHSGDLLVSRGGAPTSAMIARGNDYAGSFSHVALVHVDEDGTFRTIESHIERGVVVDGLAPYENDRKLRILLLRLHPSHAEGTASRAANHARESAESRHIPYDFASELDDPSRMFCSEVAAHAYAHEGVTLWEGLTTTSRVGVARWLSLFGVRNFETFGPSDLEYDPHLMVVAEWRNPDALWEDHVDSAAMDAMLEGADRGDALTFNLAMLPVARMLKAYSWVLNQFGAEGPVPEGMSPQAALRVRELGERHDRIVDAIEARSANFEAEHGYRPPYWELVAFAREALVR